MIRYLLYGVIFLAASALPPAQAANKHAISAVEASQRKLIESNIKAYTGLARFFVISISFPGAERVGGHHQDFIDWLEYHIRLDAGHTHLSIEAPFGAQIPDAAYLLPGAPPAMDYVFVSYSGADDKAAVRASIERVLGLAPTVGFRYITNYWSVPD